MKIWQVIKKAVTLQRKTGSCPGCFKFEKDDSLAQLVEHNTFNVGVVGSSPTRITKKSELPPQNAENHLISSVFLFALSGRIQRFSEHKRE